MSHRPHDGDSLPPSETDGRDPRVFASVAALLPGSDVLANLVPAVRAARIEPMRALRED